MPVEATPMDLGPLLRTATAPTGRFLPVLVPPRKYDWWYLHLSQSL
jgi:hypothetical protein